MGERETPPIKELANEPEGSEEERQLKANQTQLDYGQSQTAFFPAIVGSENHPYREDDVVEFVTRINQQEVETQRRTMRQYLTYLGFKENSGPRHFRLDHLLGRTTTPGQIRETFLQYLEYRRETAQRLEQDFRQESSESEKIIADTELVMKQILENSGLFENIRSYRTSDVLDKIDFIIELGIQSRQKKTAEPTEDQDEEYDSFRRIAIQFSTDMDKRKKEDTMHIPTVTIPEHLELGEMPIVPFQVEHKYFVETEHGQQFSLREEAQAAHKDVEAVFDQHLFDIQHPAEKKSSLSPQEQKKQTSIEIRRLRRETINRWVRQIVENLEGKMKRFPQYAALYQETATLLLERT